MKISGKEQTGVAFANTQYKNTNGNKNTNIKEDSHRFQCGKQDYLEAACPDLKLEPCEQLHANVGIQKDGENVDENITGVFILKTEYEEQKYIIPQQDLLGDLLNQ